MLRGSFIGWGVPAKTARGAYTHSVSVSEEAGNGRCIILIRWLGRAKEGPKWAGMNGRSSAGSRLKRAGMRGRVRAKGHEGDARGHDMEGGMVRRDFVNVVKTD